MSLGSLVGSLYHGQVPRGAELPGHGQLSEERDGGRGLPVSPPSQTERDQQTSSTQARSSEQLVTNQTKVKTIIK